MTAVTLKCSLTHDAPPGAHVYAIALTSPVAHDTNPTIKTALTKFVLEHADTPEYRHAVVSMRKSTEFANRYTAKFLQALDSVTETPTKSNIVSDETYHTYVVVDNKDTDLINKTALHVFPPTLSP
jgi:hypothetical protein